MHQARPERVKQLFCRMFFRPIKTGTGSPKYRLEVWLNDCSFRFYLSHRSNAERVFRPTTWTLLPATGKTPEIPPHPFLTVRALNQYPAAAIGLRTLVNNSVRSTLFRHFLSFLYLPAGTFGAYWIRRRRLVRFNKPARIASSTFTPSWIIRQRSTPICCASRIAASSPSGSGRI